MVKNILLVVDRLMHRTKIGHLYLDNTVKSVKVNNTNSVAIVCYLGKGGCILKEN